ncbi:MAG: helix-turn-helix domain-containing protein [Gammaproteobacteria bacterium]
MESRELYSIEEARALLGGIARNTIYELMRTAALPSVVIGRRRFVSAESISAFIAGASTTVSPAGNGARSGLSKRQMALKFNEELASTANRAKRVGRETFRTGNSGPAPPR